MALVFKSIVTTRVRQIGSWAWNRMNLARDSAFVKSFDFGPTDVAGVKALMARYAANRLEIRTINWIVPQVKHPLFAGVNTVLRFADYFSRIKGVQNRVFFYGGNEAVLPDLKKKVSASFPSLADSIHPFGDNPGDLPASDIAIATTWDSAYLLLHVKNTAGKFYFIQDFEPLFYPAGSTYGLAEATYRLGYWGIANTRGLGDHLRDSYRMTVMSFDPAVDLEVFYPAAVPPPEPVKIFFYGRPNNPRNGFVLGIEALKLVKQQFKERVHIVSAGGEWKPSAFGAGDTVQNLGLLPTIEEVAALYRTCHIGLVFMFTKHPSYQPIELMASGVSVVTNENSAMRLLLRDRENSLIVEPTVRSVSEAVSSLVHDANLRTGLISEGLKASARVRWSAQIERVYEFLCGNGETNADDATRGNSQTEIDDAVAAW